MKIKFNIRREIKIATVLVVVFGLIAFTERMKGNVAVRDIRVRIDNVHENHYLDEQDVMDLMQVRVDNIKGASIDQLNFRSIENKIMKHPFIDDAEMYSDL